MTTRRAFVAAISCALAAGCGPDEDPQYGRHGPVAEGILAPLGDPRPSATAEQLETFERGVAVAERRFERAGGLGPNFNVTFCAACHEKPVTGGSAGLYRSFFLAGTLHDDGAFTPAESRGTSGGVLRLYSYQEGMSSHPEIDDTVNVVAQRNAIPFFGVGLLAELTNEEIESRADPDDLDGDGISGRPNYDQGFVGRFGMKSQTVSIEGFIRGPLFNHLGITTDPLSEEQRALLPVDSSSDGAADTEAFAWLEDFAQAAAPQGPLTDEDGIQDPELVPADLFDLVSMAMLLAAPPIEPLDEQGRRGQEVFDELGCGSCHTPRLNGPRGPIPAYSDLLLHGMGEDLADGIRQGEAQGDEFRSMPLWGLAAVGPYLHDGRASTVDEAILWHGGEGLKARDAYAALGAAERDDLLAFLDSLGGRDQYTAGLLPRDAAVPAPGEYGGPSRDLAPEEEESFLAGRALFDRDFGYSDGAGGPRYNGDSCRACHFDPVIGGSGPRGVNVIRHGILNADGEFTTPSVGTVLHRQTTLQDVANRPQDEANIFEMRQTPHLFGLGLVAGIPEEVILANADPYDDVVPDGITGKPSYTDGGRLGRFGWKAQVPTLPEFVRDACTTELGLTIEYQDGLTFGKIHDNDEVADPEMSALEAETLGVYLELLGPPPRQEAQDPGSAEAGQALFGSVGCASCHVPALDGGDGPVPLYSDLLLHEILAPGSLGIEDASATTLEFRTAPLWGLSQTNPYWHTGEADTVQEAILLHDGEGAAARDAFTVLSATDQAALLAFLGTL